MLSRPGVQVCGDKRILQQDAGLTFSEVMSGKFSLAADDPVDGAASADQVLVMRATLTIPSIEVFLSDPQHEGRLEGSVTFPPLGATLPALSGRFRLFAPTADPNLKLMVYSMPFERENRIYTLHGVKQVRRGSVLRAWPDTTTLRCRLHAGGDETGPVCGAGILRIRMAGFARQLMSFRPVNGTTPRRRAAAVAGFFRFFAGELVDSYL